MDDDILDISVLSSLIIHLVMDTLSRCCDNGFKQIFFVLLLKVQRNNASHKMVAWEPKRLKQFTNYTQVNHSIKAKKNDKYG